MLKSEIPADKEGSRTVLLNRRLTVHLVAVLTLAVAGFGLVGAAAPPPGKGGGKDKGVRFVVTVVNPEATLYNAPTYLPTCAAITGEQTSFTALFDRHDLCATVTTNTGYQLTDDIVIQVNTTQGLITSVQLRGQDVIGEEGIMHESEAVAITPPATPSNTGFTLHVHADNLPIWKLTRHLGGKRVEIVGLISIGDMVYTPQP